MRTAIVYEPTLKVICCAESVKRAEQIIELIEEAVPEGVHAGDYGIDGEYVFTERTEADFWDDVYMMSKTDQAK